MVWIKPTKGGVFQKETYVDCNSYFSYTLNELGQLYEANELDYKGELTDGDFEQIIIGLNDSPLIVEDIKEKLPNFD